MTANRRAVFAVVCAVLLAVSMGVLGVHDPAPGAQVTDMRATGVQDSTSGLNLTASGSAVDEAGQNVTVNFTLTNAGDEPSTAPVIELVSVPAKWQLVSQSADANVTWSEAEQGWLLAAPLSPGESVSVSATFGLADDSPPTEYSVSAKASDAAGQSDTTVETFSGGQSGEGDLTLDTSVGEVPAPGENVTLDMTLQNTGDAESVAPSIGLVLPAGWSVVDQSAEENVTYSDVTVNWVSTDPLAADESLTVSAELQPPSDATPGPYVVSVRGTDASNQSTVTAVRLNVTEAADAEPETTLTETETDTTETQTTVETMTTEQTTMEATTVETVTAETTVEATTDEATTESGQADTTTEATTTENGEAETTVEGTTDEATTVEATTVMGETETTTDATTTETGQPQDISETVSAMIQVDDQPVANVTLEVADSPDERTQGLMFRESLPENHGMVFVYDEAEPRSFWMKNTLIPLDMIFVAENGTVVDVEHADPPEPNVSDEDLERYTSDAPAKYVIELEQGFANETGIEPGADVEFDVADTLEPANETTTAS